MAVRLLKLDAEGWKEATAIVSSGQSNTEITATLLRKFREVDARSILIEEEYIDRDFSDAFSFYYAKTFKRHSKLCRRLLFFSTDLSSEALEDPQDAARLLEELSADHFVGYVILRPISQAPVCQALIRAPADLSGYESYLLVKSDYFIHIFGATLKISGVPMTQQDSRIGACAQAAIWSATRHFHSRHRGPWLSTVDITLSAIANPEAATNTMVPAGSEFLTLNSMVAALRAAGREPLVHAPVSHAPINWGALRPHEVINRYIDSGIPVVVGLMVPSRGIGHAVVATGQILRDMPLAANLPPRPTRAEYCEAFFVNDDQIGPNIRMPVRPGSPVGETPYNIEQNSNFLIVPLPEKVYLPAEKAEGISWDALLQYVHDWPDIKNVLSGKLGTSEGTGDEFVQHSVSNEAFARTYLTYGWKYKQRTMQNRMPVSLKKLIRNLDVPRFVYVTEFTTISACSGKARYERRIYAHSVVDATAKNHGEESALLFHAPGFCRRYTHVNGALQMSISPIKDDSFYYPKARGQMNFANFSQTNS